MRLGYNSTIITKKRKLDCGCYDYAFSGNMCKQHATAKSVQKRMEAVTDQMIKEEGLSDLLEKADNWVSQFVRLSHSDENGWLGCYTCPVVKHFSLMDAGHFVKRGCLYLRFDTSRNIRPQCKECNGDQKTNGKQHIFREKLNAEKPGLPEILEEESVIVYKPTRHEIKEIILEYKTKVKELKKRITTT